MESLGFVPTKYNWACPLSPCFLVANEDFLPGTQVTLVLIGKSLLLEDSIPKTKDKQVPGIHSL